MWNRRNNIIKGIEVVLAAILLVVIINIFVSKSDKLFNILGYRSYIVLSGSMEPQIYPGDLLIVKHKNRVKIEVGDVVTFKTKDESIVTHRIIDLIDEGYITKGDNNNVEDKEILKEEDIIGEVQHVISKVGYLMNFFGSAIFKAIALIALAIIIIINEVRAKRVNGS